MKCVFWREGRSRPDIEICFRAWGIAVEFNVGLYILNKGDFFHKEGFAERAQEELNIF